MSYWLALIMLHVSTLFREVGLHGIGLVRSMWRLRKCFEIAARSPVLLCLGGPAHIALVFLQIMAQVFDDTFPCTITIWASYVSFGIISTAYLLRTARLVVVYDRKLRGKFIRQVRPAIQRRCMVAVLACCCAASLVVQLRFSARRAHADICYFFEDGFYVFLPITVVYLAAMVAMANRLRGTNDAFRIRNEMVLICASTAATSVLRTVHIAMLKHMPSDPHWSVPPTIYDLVACAAALYISFYRPLRAFYGVQPGRLYGGRSAERIFAVEQGDSHRLIRTGTEGVGGNIATGAPASWGVLQMLRNETMCVLLVNFCERNLCGESIDFLVDLTRKYEPLLDAEEQFETLSVIVETYLAQGSTHEINVSNSHRNEAEGWVKKKESFLALGEAERAAVLNKQRDEIAKMLSENLLFKFKQTPLAQQAMQALAEIAGGKTVRTSDYDSDMRMMLQVSAAVEVVSINRTVLQDGNPTNKAVLTNMQAAIDEEDQMERSSSRDEESTYTFDDTDYLND